MIRQQTDWPLLKETVYHFQIIAEILHMINDANANIDRSKRLEKDAITGSD